MKPATDHVWAVRGKCLNCTSDLDIFVNAQHYEIWTWGQTHNEDGTEKFNLDFLGKWRYGPLPRTAKPI